MSRSFDAGGSTTGCPPPTADGLNREEVSLRTRVPFHQLPRRVAHLVRDRGKGLPSGSARMIVEGDERTVVSGRSDEYLLDAWAADAAKIGTEAASIPQVVGIVLSPDKVLPLEAKTEGIGGKPERKPAHLARMPEGLGLHRELGLRLEETHAANKSCPGGRGTHERNAIAKKQHTTLVPEGHSEQQQLSEILVGERYTDHTDSKTRSSVPSGGLDLFQISDVKCISFTEACEAGSADTAAVATARQEVMSLDLVPGITFDDENQCFALTVDGQPKAFSIRHRDVRAAYQLALEALLEQVLRLKQSQGQEVQPEWRERDEDAPQAMHDGTGLSECFGAEVHLNAEDWIAEMRLRELEEKNSALGEATDLFLLPCNDNHEQCRMPEHGRQANELRLARTAILICLADLRDSCIPDVFVHPMDRQLRWRRVGKHMMHVRDSSVLQQLKPYIHLFELALVRDLLPHNMHPVAQRMFFSSLDMHARAAESLYFPSYFAFE